VTKSHFSFTNGILNVFPLLSRPKFSSDSLPVNSRLQIIDIIIFHHALVISLVAGTNFAILSDCYNLLISNKNTFAYIAHSLFSDSCDLALSFTGIVLIIILIQVLYSLIMLLAQVSSHMVINKYNSLSLHLFYSYVASYFTYCFQFYLCHTLCLPYNLIQAFVFCKNNKNRWLRAQRL